MNVRSIDNNLNLCRLFKHTSTHCLTNKSHLLEQNYLDVAVLQNGVNRVSYPEVLKASLAIFKIFNFQFQHYAFCFVCNQNKKISEFTHAFA